jgi:hypothetical protein
MIEMFFSDSCMFSIIIEIKINAYNKLETPQIITHHELQ